MPPAVRDHSRRRSRLPILSGRLLGAVFNALLETAKLTGSDPAEYLREAALADGRGEEAQFARVQTRSGPNSSNPRARAATRSLPRS